MKVNRMSALMAMPVNSLQMVTKNISCTLNLFLKTISILGFQVIRGCVKEERITEDTCNFFGELKTVSYKSVKIKEM